MSFAIIAAVDKNNGLGKNNTLVWRLPADMKHFTEITTETSDPNLKNVVIMGRKTWESIPEKHRPLKGRYNIILSRNKNSDQEGMKHIFNPNSLEIWEGALDDALEFCENKSKGIENIFIIGGAMLYAEAINHPDCQTIYLTRIHQTFDCDAFFPQIDEKQFQLIDQRGPFNENGLDFEFITYERRSST